MERDHCERRWVILKCILRKYDVKLRRIEVVSKRAQILEFPG
jgi:hypothetical protein